MNMFSPTGLIILGVIAIASGFLAAIIAFVSKDDEKLHKARSAFVVSLFAGAILMALAIATVTPTFTHWSDMGWFIGMYIVLIVGGVVGLVYGYNGEYEDNSTLWIALTFVVVLGFVRWFPVHVLQIGYGPNVCSVADTRAALRQLLPLEGGAILPELAESSVEKISLERSLQLARNAVPQNLQLGEYLDVANGYEQPVNGVPMNVHPLRPKEKDWAAYRRFGSKVPGFMLVDASRTDGSAQWIAAAPGNEIVFIDGDAPWSEYNLRRHVYFSFELPNGVKVMDLDGAEVDDDLKLWYVGTVMKPSQAGGARYYMPAGIITVDPHSGKITEYSLDEAREKLPWLDRILPVEAAKMLVADYAKYQDNAAVCNLVTQSGQWEIDEDPLITTRSGEQVMQFFVTTLNDSDPLVQETIYISPKTMKAYRFLGNGMLVTEKTRTLVEKRANPNLKPELYSVYAKEPAHMWFGGEQFMVYVLERGTTFIGFGAIRSDLARKENDQYVVLGNTIGELSRRANAQIASIKPGTLDNKPSEATFELRVKGVVDYISPAYMDGGDLKVIFTVRMSADNQTTTYRFRASSRTIAEALVGVGSTVTVTGQAVSHDTNVTVDVSTVINESLLPTPTATVKPLPTATSTRSP